MNIILYFDFWELTGQCFV